MINEEMLNFEKKAKAIENFILLLDGKAVQDEHGNRFDEAAICLTNEDQETVFELSEFAELVEYIEPMTEREVSMQERIDVLEALLASDSTKVSSTTKERVYLSEEQMHEIGKFYVLNIKAVKGKEPNGLNLTNLEISKRYNISASAMSTFLIALGYRDKKTNKKKITYV